MIMPSAMISLMLTPAAAHMHRNTVRNTMSGTASLNRDLYAKQHVCERASVCVCACV